MAPDRGAMSNDEPRRGRDDDSEPDDTFVSVRPEAVGDEAMESLIPIGEHINERFDVHTVLGEGGMGKVLAAEDRRLARVVAIKVMHTKMVENPSVVRRFFVEAQVGAQLEHPNILPFYSLERTEDGAPAFAMRLIEGKDLGDYIHRCLQAEEKGKAQRGRYALKTRLEHFARICDGIAYAHARGVIHRDLKPANIMLGSFNQVYVMDWGLARVKSQSLEQAILQDGASPGVVVTSSSDAKATAMGQVLGTPIYMPPEQAGGDQDRVGEASDQYALGMILHELVSLRPPRRGKSLEEALSRAAVGYRVPLERPSGEEVPPGLAAIIERSTHPEPEKRYRSVEALSADVRRFIRDEELEVMPDSIVRKVTRAITRRPVLSMGVLLALVLMGAASVVWSLEVAARRTEGLTALFSKVTELNRTANERLRLFEGGVRALAAATGELLEGAGRSSEAFDPLTPEELMAEQGPEGRGRLPIYGGQFITLAEPIYLWDGDPNEPPPSVRALAPLQGRLPAEALSLSKQARQTTKSERDGSAKTILAVQYAYVAVEDGLMVSYPGNAPYPDGFDPRIRPWYVSGRKLSEPSWGSMYWDKASGLPLMPCNMAVRSIGGEILGVAGMDLNVSLLQKRMAKDGDLMDGWRRSLVVNAEGQIMISSAKPFVPVPIEERNVVQLEDLEVEPIRRRIVGGQKSGFEKIGSSLYAFDLIHPVGLYSVFEVEASAYGF